MDISQKASEAGFRYPTAITADLHARLTPNEREKALGQSYEGRLWPEGVPQIRPEHGSAYVTGYAHDEAGNHPKLRLGVYLGMVVHKKVLESIRVTVQARQCKNLWLQGRPVYSLPTHYCQIGQHLPDYGAYHAVLITDPILPGKCQPGAKWFCWAMQKSRFY